MARILKDKFVIVFSLILFFGALLFYSRTISFELIYFDDQIRVLNHYEIHSNPENVKKVFTDSFGVYYRPIMTLAYMFDAQLGEKDFSFYHRTNVILHAFCSLLLFLALYKLGFDKYISFILGIFFALHPVLASVPSWIPARDSSLIVISMMASLVFYKLFMESNKPRENIIFYMLHLLLFTASLYTKPVAIGFPVVCLYYSFFILNKKKEFAKYGILIAGWVIMFLIYWTLRAEAVKDVLILPELNPKALIDNWLTIFDILGKIIFPYHLFLHSNFNALQLAVGSATTLAIIILMFKMKGVRKHFIIMGGLWYFLLLLPTMMIKIADADTFYEYGEWRAYAVFPGIVFIIAEFLRAAKVDFRKTIPIAVASVLLFTFAVRAFVYQGVFKDDKMFWTKYVELYPDKSFSYEGLSKHYYFAGNMEKALELGYKANEINPKNFEIVNLIATISNEIGRYNAAEAISKKYIREVGPSAEAYFSMGISLEKQDKLDEAENAYLAALRINPKAAKAMGNLGNVYYFKKDYKNAEKWWLASLNESPGLGTSIKNLVVMYLEVGNLEGARKYAEIARKYGLKFGANIQKQLKEGINQQ